MRFIVSVMILASLSWVAHSQDLPRPAAIQPAVAFWTQIYSRVSTQQGLLHDRDNLGVVYETLSFDVNRWHPARERKIKARRAHYRAILLSLANGKRTSLSEEEQRVLGLWPADVSNSRLRQAASGIRFQLGQSNRFRRGLERSGAWEPHMREILAQMGLPEQIAALPHVESSFNPDAYSRVGAAGIWQFTRPTGRRFMRVDHIVDERMDPFTATVAAGQLLKLNYSVTNDWALAITAYNHGLAGIRRAVRHVGSGDIADIIAHYDGRNWGFASRNFYPAFLAAVEVDENAHRYFGDIALEPALHTSTIKLPFYTTADAVAEAFDVDRQTLKPLNRGLLEPVWNGDKYIPRNYSLRLPERSASELQAALAQVSADSRFYDQVPDRFHTVAHGETLSAIAARHGTSVRELMVMNTLRSAHHVRAGATLRLPVQGPDMSKRETWRVRRGDTLSSIASSVDMKVADLAAANGLVENQVLQPGKVLRVDGLPAASLVTDPKPTITPSKPPALLSRTTASTRSAPGMPTPVSAYIREVSEAVRLSISPQPTSERPIPGPEALPPAGENLPTDIDLSADPSDYTVAANNTIEIQAAETLGHYAEWLDIRASDLRRINKLRYGTPLATGERLKLTFQEVGKEEFEQRRRDFHASLQSAFFENHQISGSEAYVVKSGDSLWSLTQPRTEIPLWLMRQYNPDVDFSRLQPGDSLQRPLIETR